MTAKGRYRPDKTADAERGWLPSRFGGDFRVALAFPGAYRTGMSSLGYQSILFGFASIPGVLAERVFPDGNGDGLQLLDAGFHPLQSDLFAFSLSCENDYINLLDLLSRAGFPLRSDQRGGQFPLVLAGGIATSLNPEPLAEFIDLFFIGEGEEVLEPLVEELRRRRSVKRGKEEALTALAGMPGMYAPRFYEASYGTDGKMAAFSHRSPAPPKVERVRITSLDSRPAVGRMVAPGSTFEELCLIEVNRGCGRGCRFCAAGFLYRPLRQRSADSLLKAMEEEESTGLRRRFGLLGSAVADHPDILKLTGTMLERGWEFSVSSLRLDRLQPEFLKHLKLGGARTVTLAPETGGERLRRVIGKRLVDSQVLDAVEAVAEAGIPSVKLYFMVGLPTENDEDREEIIALIVKVRQRMLAAWRDRRRTGTISVSLSCFVPKAWTPFQWHPFAGVGPLKGAVTALARRLRSIPNVKVSHDLPKWAFVQAILSQGDRRAGEILEAAHQLGGDWGKALRQFPATVDLFALRQKERSDLLPWDFIETGLKKETLWRQYRRALAGE